MGIRRIRGVARRYFTEAGRGPKAVLCGVFAAILALALIGGVPVVASAATSDLGHAAAKSARAPMPLHPTAVPQAAAGAPRVTAKQPPAAKPRQPTVAPARYSPALQAQLSALAVAKQTGKPVVVSALTTPKSEVTAEPDGMYEATSNVYPVRVERNGTWVAISTRLIRAPGGGWAPSAVGTPLVFSGGGAGPLVTVTDPASGRSVSVWWPRALPKPVISGSAALYRSVLPGVDLQLTATDSGYGEVLIVHDAAAAANPALRSLTARVEAAPGLSIARGQGGALVVSDPASNATVLTFGQSLMWDSSDTQHISMTPSADFAGSGRITLVPTDYQIGGGTASVVMRPPASALAGRAVRYPVYIDPTTGDVKTSYYVQVMQAYDGAGGSALFTEAWNTTTGTTSQGNGVTEVGYCGFSDCYWEDGSTTALTYTDRDYFSFSTTELEHSSGPGATIYDVDFNIEQLGLAISGCTAEPAQLWSTSAGISSSTTWPGPTGSPLATGSSDAGSGSCGAGYLDINSDASGNTGLKDNLQDDANHGDVATINFELRAESETNDDQYRTFMDNPTLTVYYNFPPNTPTGLAVDDAVTCTSTTYTADTTPTLYATGTDNNPTKLNLDYDFNVVNSAGSTVAASGWQTDGGSGWKSGTQASWTVPSSDTLSDGGYDFTAEDENLPADSESSKMTSGTATYDFTVQATAPAAPTISSSDYPSGQWGQASGEPGRFTVSDGGASDVAGFAYSFNNSPTVPSTSDCSYLNDGGLGTSMASNGEAGNTSGELALVQGSTAQIVLPAGLPVGRNTLNVITFNDAHVKSATVTSYVFYVPANYSGTQPAYYTSASSPAVTVGGANASEVVLQTCCGITTWPASQWWFQATGKGQSFSLTLPSVAAGTYQVGAYLTQSYNYGEVQVSLGTGGTSVPLDGGLSFDEYSPTVTNSYLDLGTETLAASTSADPNTLTFTVTGNDGTSSGYYAGVVYVVLTPTNRYGPDALTGYTGGLAKQCQLAPWLAADCQLGFASTAASASYTMSFSVPAASDYALGANLTTAPNGGTETFTLQEPGPGGSTLDIPLDGGASFDAQPASGSPDYGSQYLFLGGVYLNAGTYVLQIGVTNQAASGNGWEPGLNFVEAAPVTGATDTSFTAAMNNQGIAFDGGSNTMTSNFDLTNTASGNNLSEQTLAAAGLIDIPSGSTAGQPWTGNSFSLNGAQFTMPAPRTSNGVVVADNVIPDGQTIPLPAVYASDVALLVTASCHASAAASTIISYGENVHGGTLTSANGIIPSIPDWIEGAPGPRVVTLGYHDSGTATDSTGPPALYEVLLPANPDYPLSSITLPVMPVNLLPNSGGCGNSGNILHILAIGTVPAALATVLSGGVWTGAYDGPMDQAVRPDQTLPGETLRENVPLSSAAGGYLRIHLSNAYATTPVTFDDVTVAAQSASDAAATVATPVQATFGSSDATTLTLVAGGDGYSNPVPIPALASGTGQLTVSMHISTATTSVPLAPIHQSVEGLTTYYASGDDTANQNGSPFSSGSSLQGLYYLAGVDISDANATDGTIAVLGDQGALAGPPWTSSTDWLSYLPSALNTAGVGVPGSIVDGATSDAIPDGWWRMNGAGLDTSSTAYNSGASPASNLTLEGSPSWSTANPGTGVSAGSLSLNGTSQYATTATAAAPDPVITTTSSFAVSAWVDLSSVASGDAVAVAQDGTDASEFYLGTADGDWSFWFAGSDSASPAITSATGPAASTGTWTLLTGVYNASAGQIQLFVNGAEVASASYTPSWTAPGALTVGAGLSGGSQSYFLDGNVSDVRAYNRVLWGYNVSSIYTDTGIGSVTAAAVAAGSYVAGGGTSGLLDYAAYTASEPNLRDVIVSLGANDILQGESPETVATDLSNIVTAIQGWTDYNNGGSAVGVFLTTIPPLDMAAGDQRELNREALNCWLTQSAAALCTSDTQVANLTAAITAKVPVPTVPVLDIATAVQDGTSSPNDINPSDLYQGALTDAYCEAIATAVADGIAAWEAGPPPQSW